MMSRLVLLLAVLWYALASPFGAVHASTGPSLRAHRIAAAHAIAVVRTTTREASRAPRPDAPPPSSFATAQSTPAVAPASFVRLAAPAPSSFAAPDPESFSPIARGPPRGELSELAPLTNSPEVLSMMKQVAGYVSLAMAVVMLVGGLHLSHDMALGYVGIALAFAFGGVAFRTLRANPSS